MSSAPTFVCAACHAVQDHNTIVCEQCNKPLVFAAPTFICKDCGADVYDALGEVRERCYPCQWVADIADAEEREQVRQWLIEVGTIDGKTDCETTDGDRQRRPAVD